ncbi:hypothetical protein HDE_12066 [Halotydeus destructor]|nr:hypothetical protein HDE_12066 [Halotydeus destructor]
MKFVILISLIISEHAIWADLHYKEVYLSKSCDAYAPHSHSLSEIEGKSMVIVKAYDSSDGCEVIQFNCSIVIRPAPGQALLASPLNISVDHEVGAVRVSLDGWPTWLLDDSNKHNFLPKTEVTHVDGSVQIDFIMMRPASTWRHANFSLLLTSFLREYE